MIELNLLPDVKQEFVRSQRQKRRVIAAMVLVSVISVGVVVLLGFYTYAAQPVRQKLADDAIAGKTKELQGKKNIVRNLTIQNQLASINELHELKPVYERVFDYLKVLNPEAPNNVSISKATIGIDSETDENTLTLEASAKDFQAVTVFKDTLENAQLSYKLDGKKVKTPLFTEVLVSDTGLGKDSSGQQVASFKVTLSYDENTFSWLATDIDVTVPNKKTNQSASNVFADAPVKKEGQ